MRRHFAKLIHQEYSPFVDMIEFTYNYPYLYIIPARFRSHHQLHVESSETEEA